MKRIIIASFYSLAVALAFSSITQAICEQYAAVQAKVQASQKKIATINQQLQQYEFILSSDGRDPFNRQEVLRDREYRREDLQTERAELTRVLSELQACLVQ